MKKFYTLLFAMALLIPTSYAQKGLSLGLNGEGLSPSIINQNTWGNGREYDYELTFSSSLGLDVGYNFNDKIGAYSGFSLITLGQKYTDTYQAAGSDKDSDWTRQIKFKYRMIPLMFKFSSSERIVNFIGGMGVSFAFMSSAEQTWTQDGNAFNEQLTNPITNKEFDLGASDVTNRYNKSDIFVNLELGARIMFSDNIYMDAVLDMGYGLKDINAADWQIPNSDGEYNASHNAYGGIKIGIAYLLFTEE